MPLFNDEVKQQLRDIFVKLNDDVNILYFHQELGCDSCAETKEFLTEIAELNDKLKLEVLNYVNDKDQVELYGINKTPAIVVLDKDKTDFGVRFYGIPAGYEINSFIFALMEMSGVGEDFPQDILDKVKTITTPIHIQVFVTPSCPHCPGAVITGHKLAKLNPNIKADMVEANSFPELSRKYNVSGVPKIIINETHELVGNQPVTEFLKVIEQLEFFLIF